MGEAGRDGADAGDGAPGPRLRPSRRRGSLPAVAFVSPRPRHV